ncbi:MAG: hypothetical protein VCB78_03870 [Myxococcota bacterium]
MKLIVVLSGLLLFAAACAMGPSQTATCRGPSCSPLGSEEGNATITCEGWWCPSGTIETGVEETSTDNAEDHGATSEVPVAEWAPDATTTEPAASDDTAEDHGVAPQTESDDTETTASEDDSKASDEDDSGRGWPRLIYEVPTRER